MWVAGPQSLTERKGKHNMVKTITKKPNITVCNERHMNEKLFR